MLNGFPLLWPWHPGSVIFLLVLSGLYTGRLLYMRHRSGRHAQETMPRRYQCVAFFSAIAVMALLLLTPVDTAARTQLFAVHMAQVVILVTLCAPLILLGCPEGLLHPLVKWPLLRSLLRALTHPLVASLIFNLTFFCWHAPSIYDRTLVHPQLYTLALLTLFLGALLNWWPLLGSLHELRRMSYPLQMLYAFFDGQPVDIFAFVLVFSGVPIYTYGSSAAKLGLSPFADQAVGGALLLIPGLVDLVVMTPLFFRWLGQIEQKARLADLQRVEEEELDEEEEEEDQEEIREKQSL